MARTRYPGPMWRALSIMATMAGACGALGAAPAATKKECAAAYEEAQSLRQEGKLTIAREKALFCSQTACPAVMQGDCSKWLSEIEASLPTVVFQVLDAAGQETAGAQVSVDGAQLVSRTDGKAVRVDPGEHRFRFELAGAEPVERTIVLREGDKLRKIEVSFAAPKAPAPTATPTATEKPAPPPAGGMAFPIAMGAFGVVAIGAGITFAVIGFNDKAALERSCAPRCTKAQVDSVRTTFLVTDITVGAGIGSLVVAGIVYLATRNLRPETATAPLRGVEVGAAVSAEGASAVVQIPF